VTRRAEEDFAAGRDDAAGVPMNRGSTGGQQGRQTATSYLQVAAAVGVLLVVGFIAELKSRELSIQTQRTEIAVVLESLRTRLEGTLGDQLDVLSRLAGTMSAVPDMPDARLQEFAGALMEDAAPVIALAAAWDDGRMQLRGPA
jgi:sensor domain CHASE-containing protein